MKWAVLGLPYFKRVYGLCIEIVQAMYSTCIYFRMYYLNSIVQYSLYIQGTFSENSAQIFSMHFPYQFRSHLLSTTLSQLWNSFSLDYTDVFTCVNNSTGMCIVLKTAGWIAIPSTFPFISWSLQKQLPAVAH